MSMGKHTENRGNIRRVIPHQQGKGSTNSSPQRSMPDREANFAGTSIRASPSPDRRKHQEKYDTLLGKLPAGDWPEGQASMGDETYGQIESSVFSFLELLNRV